MNDERLDSIMRFLIERGAKVVEIDSERATLLDVLSVIEREEGDSE
jgi:hypothetical protein